jgi:hypothetical protein
MYSSLLSKNVKIYIYIKLSFFLLFLWVWNLFCHIRQNRVPKMIGGPNRDEVRGDWKRLNNEKLQCFYPSPNTVSLEWSRQRRWNGLGMWHVMGRTEMRKEYQTAYASTQRYIPYQDQIKMYYFSKCFILFNIH